MKRFLQLIGLCFVVVVLIGCNAINKVGEMIGVQVDTEYTSQSTMSTKYKNGQKTSNSSNDNTDKSDEVKKVLTVLTVSDTILSEIEDFESLTQCDVQVNVVDINGFTQMLAGEMQNNENIPDIIIFESSDLHNDSINPYLYDLTDLAKQNELELQQIPGVYQFGFDSNKKMLGMTYQANPVALFYRRSIATYIFGIDKPEYIQGLLTSYESIGQMASKLAANNIKFMPDLYGLRYFKNIESGHWIDNNGAYNENSSKVNFLETIKQLKADQAVAFATEWSDDWIKGMYGSFNNEYGEDMQVFAYALPSWALQQVLMLASPPSSEQEEGAETNVNTRPIQDEVASPDMNSQSNENSQQDSSAHENSNGREETIVDYNPTSGDWGVAAINNAGFLGGDYLSIYKDTPNLELAQQFLSYMVADVQHRNVWSVGSHQLFADKNVLAIQPFVEENKFLGGQNFEQAFKDIAVYHNTSSNLDIKEENKLKEAQINLLFDQLMMEFIEGDFHTVDEAMMTFEIRVQGIYPELFGQP